MKKKTLRLFAIALVLVIFTNSCGISNSIDTDFDDPDSQNDVLYDDAEPDIENNFDDSENEPDGFDINKEDSQEPDGFDMDDEDSQEPNDFNANEEDSQESKEDDDYYIEEIDGFVELKNYSKLSSSLQYCYNSTDDYYDKSNPFRFIWKNANETIPKIRKESTIGITNPWEEVNLVKIDPADAQYMIPMNFWDDLIDDEEMVDNYPDKLSRTIGQYSDNFDFDTGDLLSPGNPLVECNDTDLTEFVNENSFTFFEYATAFSFYGYKLIQGEKDEEFKFGGYVGTEWQEFIATPNVEFYKVYYSNTDSFIEIPTEKTKNGYFSVDFSDLEPGIYYVSTYQTFIELV